MNDPISNLYHSDESPEQHAERLESKGQYAQEVENDDRADVSCRREEDSEKSKSWSETFKSGEDL